MAVERSRDILQGDSLSNPMKIGERVKRLRDRLGLTQRELADRIGIAQQSVQKIESGRTQPASMTLIALGNIAGDPDCWFFWERGGVDIDVMDRELYRKRPALDIAAHGINGAEVLLMPVSRNIAVPIVRDADANLPVKIIPEENIEDYFTVPRGLCQHPENTICVRVRSDAMSPIMAAGSFAAIDTLQKDPQMLIKKMVAAISPSAEIYIRWMAEGAVLVPHHLAVENPPIFLSVERDWKIVGEVVWWVNMVH
ncbi:MAG TPA: XRE family transcriptional regulator [Terriglobia bacterium]|nr:XRE family transcriptional regulator [Terriglobia bacterium]